MISPLLLQIGACGHQGNRARNDDHYLLGRLVEQDATLRLDLPLRCREVAEYGFLVAVADGMGGYEGGALASRLLLETLGASFTASTQSIQDSTEGWLRNARARVESGLEAAHLALEAHIRRENSLREAGSTLVGLVISPQGEAQGFHLGDSRLLRASDGFLRALTTDHTPLAADLAAGRISPEAALHSPLGSQVSRSFGAHGRDVLEWGEVLELREGDIFLLLSDGAHGLGRGLSRSQMEEIVGAFARSPLPQNPDEWAQTLVQRAVEADGSDNTTVLVVHITSFARQKNGATPTQASEPLPFSTPPSEKSDNAPRDDAARDDALAPLDPFAF